MHFKTLKMTAISGFLTALECTKFVFGRGSAPDPAGGADDAPPDLLVGWGGGIPLSSPPHSPPLDAFGVSVSLPTVDPPAVLIPPPNAWGLDKTLCALHLSTPHFLTWRRL